MILLAHLRPVFDAQRRCPKCGGEASAKHVTWDYLRFYPDAIRRRCERCDYVWDENPLDAER